MVVEILHLNEREIRGYYDRHPRQGDPFGLTYLGDERLVDPATLADTSIFVGVGDNKRREEIFDWAKRNNLSLAGYAAHPHARISPSASIGAGSLVGVHGIVNVGAKIGSGAIINSGSIVEHDAVIGDFAHVAPGATVLGGAHVGRGCLIGSGCVILPGVRVGDYATVGAGAVVVADVPPGITVKGVPAKP